MIHKILAICFLVGLYGQAQAQIDCKVNKDRDYTEPKHFKELFFEAKTLGKSICESYGLSYEAIDPEVSRQYALFSKKAEKLASEAFKDLPLHGLDQHMKAFKELTQKGIDKSKLPYFVVQHDPNQFEMHQYGFQITDDLVLLSKNLSNPDCNPAGKASCLELLRDLEAAINPYKDLYVAGSARDVTKELTVMNQAWNRYFEKARAQTLLDIAVTTHFESEHLKEKGEFGPMPRQWFFLHPSIYIESVDQAPDGQQLQEALGMEWFGVNWWDHESSPINYPIGFSLTSLYSDRENVSDVGHGVTVHINNKYSIGWATHGGDNGIFLSIDFLKFFDSKKKDWAEYAQKIDEYRK